MNEQDVRALVREAIERHLGRPDGGSATQVAPYRAGNEAPDTREARYTSSARLQSSHDHPSHVLLKVIPGSDVDGMCVIEPQVRCNHCGFCQSYGH